MKFYRINNCIWFSNNESKMYYYFPNTLNNENSISYKPFNITYNNQKAYGFDGNYAYVPMHFPMPNKTPSYSVVSYNRLVLRAGYEYSEPRYELEDQIINVPIPAHQHYLTPSGDKGGLCTPDNKENATNNGNSFKYAFIGSRSSQTYKNIFEPCDNIPSGPVIGTTGSTITIPPKSIPSLGVDVLLCTYKIPITDKDKSLKEIIRPLYNHFSNWSTAGKNITYTTSNPWGDRTVDDIFV